MYSSHRTRHTFVCSCTMLLVALAIPYTGFAQKVMSQEERTQTFNELLNKAKAEYQAENFRQAIKHLLSAHLLQPNPQLYINVALSYQKLNDCAKALTYFKAYIRSGDGTEALVKLAQKAIAKEKKCGPYRSDFTGVLTIDSDPKGAHVTLNGEDLGPAPIHVAGFKKGVQKVKLELEGYAVFEQDITLGAEKDGTYSLKLKKVEPSPSNNANHSNNANKDNNTSVLNEPLVKPKPERVLNIPALAIAGAGLVGVAAGAAFDLAVIPGIDAEREEFERDSDDYKDLSEDRAGAATNALVAYSIGGVLIAGGVGWFVYDMFAAQSATEEVNPAEEDDGFSSLKVAPVFHPEHWGVVLQARF